MLYRVASVAVLLIASSSFAQVIYQPVQYQYGQQSKFYYGGSDPQVIDYAAGPRDGAGRWGRVHGFDFVSGNIDTHREVTGEIERVYADAVPYQNARIYGYTATDARNEAYARVPTYFRKSDLLASAEPAGDGSWVVPAQARPVPGLRIYSTAPRQAPVTTRPLLIIPKKALEQQPVEVRKVASAD